MPHLPHFIAPTRHTDPAAALAQVQRIYTASLAHLRSAMQRFVSGDGLGASAPGARPTVQKVRACYPFVRVHTDTVARLGASDLARLSYGFVAGPGHYETTLTRPDLFGHY